MGAGSPVSWFAAVKAQSSGTLSKVHPVLQSSSLPEVGGPHPNSPVLAVMRQLPRVAGTGVGACDPSLGQIRLHHVVDVMQDNLVAVEEHNTLYGHPGEGGGPALAAG